MAAGIYQSCLDAKSTPSEMVFDESDFIYKLHILKRYLTRNLEMEYEALNGIYNSLERLKSPTLVKRVFIVLYQTQTITKEGFDVWKNRNLKRNKNEFSYLKNFLSF